jgi:hypothetical protein
VRTAQGRFGAREGAERRQIDRLLDLHHASTIAQLAALAVCGKREKLKMRPI